MCLVRQVFWIVKDIAYNVQKFICVPNDSILKMFRHFEFLEIRSAQKKCYFVCADCHETGSSVD